MKTLQLTSDARDDFLAKPAIHAGLFCPPQITTVIRTDVTSPKGSDRFCLLLSLKNGRFKRQSGKGHPVLAYRPTCQEG